MRLMFDDFLCLAVASATKHLLMYEASSGMVSPSTEHYVLVYFI